MTLILKKIQNTIKVAINNILPFKEEIHIEKIKNPEYGDYSSNIAMILAPKLKLSPQIIAQKVMDFIKDDDFFSEVSFAFPGFINMKVKPKYLVKVISNINEMKEKFGQGQRTNIKYNLEIVSANPTGFLHLGHARNGAIGDSIARILKFAGNSVQTEYYINDAGNQINVLANTVFIYYLQLLGKDIELLEESYRGEPQQEVAKLMIHKYQDKFINDAIVDGKIDNEKTLELFKKEAIAFFLYNIKAQLTTFRIKIDHWSSEFYLYQTNKLTDLVTKLKATKNTYLEDGALWLTTSSYGDDKDRVIIKSDGTYTYLLPDLACHDLRLKRVNADFLLNFWGGDHHGYINRMRAGLEILGYKKDVLEVYIIQMVRLIKDGKEYKMSKRKGTAVWLVDLIAELGVDAVRYLLCSKNFSSHMELDLGLLQQQNNSNPVYYFQYATTRCASILRNLENNMKTKANFDDFSLLINPKERELIKTMDFFSKAVILAANGKQPNIICDYIQELAKQFHSYYGSCKVIDKDNLLLTQQRVVLIKAVQQVFKNALSLIAVEAKEEM